MEQRITPEAMCIIPEHHDRLRITAKQDGAPRSTTEHHGAIVYLIIYSLFQNCL